MLNKIINSETLLNTKKLFSLLRMSNVSLWFLALSSTLSLCFTFISMYIVYLLFPLTRGIIQNDFSHVKELVGLNFIVTHFSSINWSSTKFFILLVIWIYFFTIIKNVFSYFSSLSTQFQAKQATTKLRQMLLEKCLGYGKSFYDKNTVSYLQAILTKSTLMIESQFRLFQTFTTQMMLLFANLLFMVLISWKLTLITFIFFPVITFFTQQITKKVRGASEEQKRLTTNLNEKIFNMLYCMPVIKGFSKEKDEINKFLKISNEEIDHAFKTQRLIGLAGPVEDMGTMTSVLMVAFALALVMSMEHYSLDPSKAFVFFYLATKIMPGLNAFNRFKIGAAQTVTGIYDIESILNQDNSSYVVGGQEEFTGLQGSIEFKDLVFSYGNKGPVVLDNINFSIEKRSIVAIVGPSGSGKSTLMHLLLRFYDCPPGSIFINGKDIKNYDISSLRKHLAFVSQEVLLFNDTIRNNMTYGSSSDISEEFLTDIGVKLQVHDFVEKMPHGYETSVGERGGRFSGGERQRLSIARAVIKDPEILIMDEATSALDSETESRINDSLVSMTKEKTLIIIAHRLSTIKRADKIIYIDKGRVVESGTLKELMDKKGFFYNQFEAQKIY